MSDFSIVDRLHSFISDMPSAVYMSYGAIMRMDRAQLMSRLSGAVTRGVISQNAMDKVVAGSRL